MLKKPDYCKDCPLYQNGEGFVPADGIGSNKVLLVGESAGYNEAQQGIPFSPMAQAGSVLHRIIRERIKKGRDEFAIHNLLSCRPFGDKLLNAQYEYEAVNKCRYFLDETIKKYNPKVIVALGAVPFKHLTGLEGYKLNIQTVRGYVFKSSRYEDVLVVPSFHPSYIRRGNMHLMNVLLWDLMKAVNLAQGKLVEGKDYILDPISIIDKTEFLYRYDNHSSLNYITNPTIEQAMEFYENVKQNPNLLIAYDIETEKSVGVEEDEMDEYGQTITLIQFSIGPNSGIALPYVDPFIDIARSILATNNPKCGHNIHDFDNPILRTYDFEINSRLDDTMWIFHHYQPDLPLGLQFVSSFVSYPFPWKHYAGENLEFYGIADVDSVQWIMNDLPKKMESRGLWKGYNEYVYKFKPILEATQQRGLTVNREKQKKFEEEIEKRKKEIQDELNEIIPTDFIRYHPENGYVREPSVITQTTVEYYRTFPNHKQELLEYIFEKTGLVKRKFSSEGKPIKVKKQKPRIEPKGLSEQDIKNFEAIGIYDFSPEVPEILEATERWCKVIPFNPNSPDQVSNYIKYKGHTEVAKKLAVNVVRENKEEGEIEENNGKKKNLITSKAVLKGLYSKFGDKEYELFVEFKELTKMKGTYLWKSTEEKCNVCSGIGKYYIGRLLEDVHEEEEVECIECNGSGLSKYGKVHTTFTLRPATMQTSSRNPNIQNAPERTSLAERFKETIEVPEGFLIAKMDYKSFHALMLGFLAEDHDYMRLARLDIHSYVTAHMVQHPMRENCLKLEDSELEKYLSLIKEEYKSLRDDQAKRVILGIGFGLSEKGCYERFSDKFNPSPEEVLREWGTRRKVKPEDINPKTGVTYLQELTEMIGRKRVKDLYKLVKGLFPKVFSWQDRTIMKASEQGYIDTPFGARRWFTAATEAKYDKFGNVKRRYDGKLDVGKGEQAEESLAYPVANSAFCHLREGVVIMGYREELKDDSWNTMVELHKGSLLDRAGLCNMVHDDLRFEIREDKLGLLGEVKKVMERKSSILVNDRMNPREFSCQVDIQIGRSLAKLEKYKCN